MRLLLRLINRVVKKAGLALTCQKHSTYHGTHRRPKGDCTACALLFSALK